MTRINDIPNEASFYARTGRYRWVIAEWMMSTDHKRIGVMYLAALLSFFSVGVVLGFLIRLSLLSPGMAHGCTDLQRVFHHPWRHPDLSLYHPGNPRCLREFLSPYPDRCTGCGLSENEPLVLVALCHRGPHRPFLSIEGTPPDTGWTFYAPYSIRTPANISIAVLGVFVLGFSSI